MESKLINNHVIFLNNKYDWKEMSLWNYLQNGNIPTGWKNIFLNNQELLYTISEEIKKEVRENVVYPPINFVFRTFSLPLDKIKVMVIGMDPYFNGSAVGLCFSVKPGNKINNSLQNIYTEMELEGFPVNRNGDLTHWLKQGVFMLNMSLSVNKGDSGSHTRFWYPFTKKVVRYIAENRKDIVWLLWGRDAHGVIPIVNDFGNNNHKIIASSHPVGYAWKKQSGGYPPFYNSNSFKEANNFLESTGKNMINW
jgi:uracil-DNA glycosylase